MVKRIARCIHCEGEEVVDYLGTAPNKRDKRWRPLEERKEALKLYYNEGKTQKEIVESMNLYVNKIKSWIHRARLENVSKESTIIRLMMK